MAVRMTVKMTMTTKISLKNHHEIATRFAIFNPVPEANGDMSKIIFNILNN